MGSAGWGFFGSSGTWTRNRGLGVGTPPTPNPRFRVHVPEEPKKPQPAEPITYEGPSLSQHRRTHFFGGGGGRRCGGFRRQLIVLGDGVFAPASRVSSPPPKKCRNHNGQEEYQPPIRDSESMSRKSQRSPNLCWEMVCSLQLVEFHYVDFDYRGRLAIGIRVKWS
jgi:hypothetical protein